MPFYKGSGIYSNTHEIDAECINDECTSGEQLREVEYETGDNLGTWECEECGTTHEYEFPDITDIDYDPYDRL